MAFQVGDLVKKVGKVQKYVVKEVLQNNKYQCTFPEPMNQKIKFKFKESDLEISE